MSCVVPPLPIFLDINLITSWRGKATLWAALHKWSATPVNDSTGVACILQLLPLLSVSWLLEGSISIYVAFAAFFSAALALSTAWYS
jgi:hypothetical protein